MDTLKVGITEQAAGTYIVKLNGRLDADTYLFLKEKLKPIFSQKKPTLIFDFTLLTYISSAGMGVIFEARKIVELVGGLFAMTNLQPQIKKAFEIVNNWPGMSIFKSMEEVDHYLAVIEKREAQKYKPFEKRA